MSRELRCALVSTLCVMALAVLPSMAPAQPTTYSQRLSALRQQNAFRQQQSAVQNAVQQTAILVQTVNQQNGLAVQSVMPTPTSFLQQQTALQTAMQQTRALLQTSRQNPAVRGTALGQLNTLQAVMQQSIFLQNALATQNNVLTPAQLLLLSQEQPSLLRLLISQPAALLQRTPGTSSP